jgi:hypothetical protein
LFDDARAKLDSAGVLRRGLFYTQGKAVITRLLEEGAISFEAYHDIVENREIAEALLEGNFLLSYHFDIGKVTFQSTLVERYCSVLFQHYSLLVLIGKRKSKKKNLS